MKRLSEFFKMVGRKAWRFAGDDRLGLAGGVMLLAGVKDRLVSQEYELAWFELLVGLILVVCCWIALGPKRKPAEQPEVHP